MPTHPLNAEHGQVIVLAAIVASIVLGMAGLAIDVGFAMHERGKVANAADAASMAGAGVLLNGGDNEAAITAALSYAEQNGYHASSTTVNIPPLSGPHKGNSTYVEVIINTTRPTYFMRVLQIPTETVSARAVAGFVPTPKNYALVILDHTACPAYTQSSSSSLTINGGGALVNSSCNPSATQSGGSSVTADYLDYYYKGGWQLGNNASTSVPPEPVGFQLADPLAGLARPPAREVPGIRFTLRTE